MWKKTKYLAKDLRPVFPEERLLLEILLNKKINEFIKSSVWAVNNRYYIDGKSLSISGEMFRMADTDAIRESLEKYKGNNSYEYFEKHIETFIKANRGRLNYLKEESFEFVKNTASKFDEEKRVISFSGGKDSTVTADVVVKALSNPNLVHIFGNTTLEFPSTVAYAERYRENHPQSIFLFAKNDEQVFYDVCEDIGPPARMMRWCCSMFKTGPITRVINSKMAMKFRAHDTFFIRKGWLSKGMERIVEKPDLFIDKDENPMDILGIGANMVKALRYWLQAVGLTSEPTRGRRIQTLTGLGEQIYENDRLILTFGKQRGIIV